MLSGSLASWFVDRVSAAEETAERAEFAELRTRMHRMERQIAELHAALVPAPATDLPAPRERSAPTPAD